MSISPRKPLQINLNFKQKYAEGIHTPNSPYTSTSRSQQQNLTKEEQIKLVLKKSSNERNTQDIILLSQQIENVNFLKQFIGTKSLEFLEMCKYLEVEEYEEGHILFQQGDIGEKFFIILEGQVAVLINVQTKKNGIEQKEIGKLSAGDSFGDLALLFNSIRNATIKLSKKSTFIVLRKEIFQKYIKYKTPPNAHEILKFYDQFVLYPYQLDLPEKIQILSKTEQTNYISNSLIIRQGQLVSSIYFIKKGVVKVNRIVKFRINPTTKQLLPLDYSDPTPQEIQNKQYKDISLEIDEIYEGSVFADYEQFKQIKSTVSIVAYTPCEILQIQREDMVVLPNKMIQDLQNNIKPYPEDYKLRRIYLEGLQWLKYKNVVVEGVCRENVLRKRLQNSVNFFSRSKLQHIPLQPHLVTLEDSFTQDTAQGDVQQIENKFFGQYNQQMNKRRSLQTYQSLQNKGKGKPQFQENKKSGLNISKNEIKKTKDMENDQKNEFAMQAAKNSFYLQDENDFVKFDEELQEIEKEDDQYDKKKILKQLMKQLDPFNRTTLSQKKLPMKNDLKSMGKSFSNLQQNEKDQNKKNKGLAKFSSTYSPKLQTISSEIQSKKYKPQKQILPRITNHIQYIARNEDIICQSNLKLFEKSDYQDEFSPF
ncbi:cyclic nucleotide-binding domain protein (macronuclear) [Tetrahymena thermophila SB210]|uniref:Cyclic nucleotide-binding domain protein n=1 Tax=Tetrahymena thermophila (strain SB210) TaxID=312017 RepID=Q22UZ6_TETTS|nr:cyclic nucleotide-binding domain protein [Tetrahymena thermophila SB210]EAR89152.2 cyclic nucleotide-binding domain protein [Tetrahymena thermophila SB210]|eukprot:XP_001009397.2 cyclic nucleotide-binding domain protein [Tetrahymena thermophila SB210]